MNAQIFHFQFLCLCKLYLCSCKLCLVDDLLCVLIRCKAMMSMCWLLLHHPLIGILIWGLALESCPNLTLAPTLTMKSSSPKLRFLGVLIKCLHWTLLPTTQNVSEQRRVHSDNKRTSKARRTPFLPPMMHWWHTTYPIEGFRINADKCLTHRSKHNWHWDCVLPIFVLLYFCWH